MSDEYMPTTEDVRFDYATTTKADSHSGEARARAFNRWLARVKAEAQVEALEDLATAHYLDGPRSTYDTIMGRAAELENGEE